MKIATRLGCAFLISLFAIVLLACYSHSNVERINEARKWVEHTGKVILETERMESALKELESRTRGYVASGDERYLDGTVELKERIRRSYDQLKISTNDNPTQQQNLARVSPLLGRRVQQMERLTEARKQGVGEAIKFMRLPEKGTQWEWMSYMDKIKAEEDRLLKIRTDTATKSIEETEQLVVLLAAGAMLLVGCIGAYMIVGLTKSLAVLIDGTQRVSGGDLNFRLPITTKDEVAVLGRAFNSMIDRLRAYADSQKALDWHRSNLNKFAIVLQGKRDPRDAGAVFLSELVPLLEAHQAALYVVDGEDEDVLKLVATYGGEPLDKVQKIFRFGEGLVGQSARDKNKMILHEVDAESFIVKSALAQSKPFEIVIVPIVFEGGVKGVVEIASLNEFTSGHQEFLDELCTWVGATLNSIDASAQVDRLLDEAQMMNEELQAQQEELESQQDELRSTNEELEEKADVLDLQNQEISDKNIELEQMQISLEAKNNELTLASRYKSEFLANMSHDLRTPLNSLLIFSELLGENEEKNLEEFQVEYAKNIHSAGKTLLSLIDDVLDLSKIESGTVVLDMTDVMLTDITSEMQRNFEKSAEAKGLQFVIKVTEAVPAIMRTDYRRLSQLLTNLLANAFKFTESGSVQLLLDCVEITGGADGHQTNSYISFKVIDTGIGIEKDKQELVFEAFRQADSSVKRKYGGTGLGLAICRQLSELLGGFIELKSAFGEGCTFTVVLPVTYEGRRERITAAPRLETPVKTMRSLERTIESTRDLRMMTSGNIEDDRRSIEPDDRVLLMIEDDPAFAKTLLDLARKHKFKGVVAMSGFDGLELARKLVPDGITLDLNLPDMQGWVVLDQLKIEPETRHIPVHIISVDKEPQRSLEVGAVGYIEKPVTINTMTDAINKIKTLMAKQQGRILLVEHDSELRKSLSELISDAEIFVSQVETGEEALKAMDSETFDCVVIDINLKDASGMKLIDSIQRRSESVKPPVLVYADRPLSAGETEELKRLRRSSTVKDVDSPERLLSEVLLFLHRVEATLPEQKRQLLDSVRQIDAPLSGRKVLIVDDDPRNIAAMKGALQKQKMNLLYAENGKEAIQKLKEEPDIELVLMDMMMPEMDGYEAMQVIRREEQFYKLPIIAVTAKAMKEDRRKCLEAGASDYIAKPVDRSQLLSLLRVWLYRR